jgi:hypothetical protein
MEPEVSMIELTDGQRAALAGGDTLVRDAATNETYVLLRKTVYDQLQALLGDGAVVTTAEMLDTVMAEDDANDPYLADYQRKYARP